MIFKGKTVFVTGAASGIGRATAEAFLKRGAYVAAVDINSVGLQGLVAEHSDKSERLLPLTVDITQSSQVDDAVGKVVKWTGQIDVLVNSAGIYRQSMLVDMSDEFWDTTQKINMYGTFYCCRAVAREMIKRRFGRIINLASIAGQRGSVANCHYTTHQARGRRLQQKHCPGACTIQH